MLHKLALFLVVSPILLTKHKGSKGIWLRTQGRIRTHQVQCHLWITSSVSSPDRLIYNRTSRATQFPDGVDVRVPGFGKTFSLEFLDPSKSSVGM